MTEHESLDASMSDPSGSSAFGDTPAPRGSTAMPSMHQFKSFLSAELRSFKEDLKRQNDESINDAVKRMRFETASRHQFKSKGNEEQFLHEEKVATHVDSAIRNLESGKLYQVRESLEEGKTLIATRMKHIVLADMHGWDFVSEYKSDPIAEDDIDEKRIRKVLKSVESQREKKKAEKAKKANKFKFDANRRFMPARNEFNNPYSINANCYLCGKLGHFWRSCTYRSRLPASNGATSALGVPNASRPALQPLPTIVPSSLSTVTK